MVKLTIEIKVDKILIRKKKKKRKEITPLRKKHIYASRIFLTAYPSSLSLYNDPSKSSKVSCTIMV